MSSRPDNHPCILYGYKFVQQRKTTVNPEKIDNTTAVGDTRSIDKQSALFLNDMDDALFWGNSIFDPRDMTLVLAIHPPNSDPRPVLLELAITRLCC